jgi:predicted RNA methylase
MNAYTPSGNQNDSQNLPALPFDIEQICAGRDRAIAHWLEAYDAFHVHTAAARAASMGGSAVVLRIPHGHSWEDSRMAKAFTATGEIEQRNPESGRYEKVDAREQFRRLVTHEIDRANWRHLLDVCGFDALLDRQAREEFETALREDPPIFDTTTCAATFGDIYGNRRQYFLRGLANAFMALDRRFRSHNGFKIGARLIINNAVSYYGTWNSYDRRDTLFDIERIFWEIDGKSVKSMKDQIASIVPKVEAVMRDPGQLPAVVQGDYFRVRVFKNGNLHLWFERKDLQIEVNKLLAEFYGEVIGDGYNTTKAEEAAPQYHVTPAKGWGAFMSSDTVARQVIEHACPHGMRVLEPSAGTGMLAKAAREAGASEVVCVEIQRGMAHELAQAGFKTYCSDFTAIPVGGIGNQFDVIVMNPPFDRGRDCDHVRHAWQFLKPGGRLVAVMSARAEFGEDARHRALHKLVDAADSIGWGRRKWFDLPAGSFAHAGTNVNTVILAIKKAAT